MTLFFTKAERDLLLRLLLDSRDDACQRHEMPDALLNRLIDTLQQYDNLDRANTRLLKRIDAAKVKSPRLMAAIDAFAAMLPGPLQHAGNYAGTIASMLPTNRKP